MKIKKLTIKGFRSFRHYTEIEFPDSGLISIQGKDLRSGASSGSGKSSILEAVFFALGQNDLPATELLNFDSDEIAVSLTGTAKESEFRISRSSTKLELEIDGKSVKGSKPDLKKRIADLLGGDEDLFRFLSYRRQLDRGLFFHKDDTTLKGILGKCFPELEKAERVAEEAKKTLSSAESALKELKPLQLTPEAVEDIQKQLDNEKKKIPELDNQIETLQRDTILADSEELLELIEKKNTLELEATPAAELRELDAKILEKTKESKGIEAKHNSETLQYDRKKNEIKQSLIKLADERNKLVAQRGSFLAAICPTCENTDKRLVGRVAECDAEILKITSEAENQLKLVKTLSCPERTPVDRALIDINRDIEQLRARKEALGVQVESKQARLRAAAEEIKVKRKSESDVTAAKRSELSAKKSVRDSLVRHVGVMAAQLLDAEKIRNRTEKLEKQVEIETAVYTILGKKGLSGLFFAELLRDAEVTANKILETLPNTADLTIRLSQNAETSTGIIKNRLSATFSKGDKSVSFKSLSGGQQTSASFATDVSLILAVKRRSHMSFDFLILDEPMDGMGKAEKEAALETLRTLLDGRLIILIDHATEINEMFDEIIKVEYDGYTSKII